MCELGCIFDEITIGNANGYIPMKQFKVGRLSIIIHCTALVIFYYYLMFGCKVFNDFQLVKYIR